MGMSKPAACASGGEEEACWDPARPGMGMGLPLSDFTQPQCAVRAMARGHPSPSQHACAQSHSTVAGGGTLCLSLPACEWF